VSFVTFSISSPRKFDAATLDGVRARARNLLSCGKENGAMTPLRQKKKLASFSDSLRRGEIFSIPFSDFLEMKRNGAILKARTTHVR